MEKRPTLPQEHTPAPDIDTEVDLFVADIQTVEENGIIRISTLEADPNLYNNPKVVAALQAAALEKHADIRINTGPIIVVDDAGENGLLALVDQGLAQMVHRDFLMSDGDYRIIEATGKTRYQFTGECDRPPLEARQKRQVYNRGYFTSRQWQAGAENKAASFDEDWEDYSRGGYPIPFLLTTTLNGMREIMAAANSQQRVLDYMYSSEILVFAGTSDIVQKVPSRQKVA